jgi:membrane-associated phospholipid phosphatase
VDEDPRSVKIADHRWRMLRFEWVAAGYFVLLAAAAIVAPAMPRSRVRGAAASSAAALLIVLLSRTTPVEARFWLAHLYLGLGYWIPSLFTARGSDTPFETWLRQSDEEWRRFVPRLTAAAAAILELAYLSCYFVVPAAFVIAWVHGNTEQVDRYWLAVLLSGFACYGSLPWLVSRPPRMFGEPHASPPATSASAFNMSVLRRVSHELNTFPSGHVAVAIAVALTMAPISWTAGAVFGMLAAGIAVGAAVGRYHYGVDVIAGALVGIAAALISV